MNRYIDGDTLNVAMDALRAGLSIPQIASNLDCDEETLQQLLKPKPNPLEIVGRDDLGRPIAADGWPVGGLATVKELVAFTGMSRGKLYVMLDGPIPSIRIGGNRRVDWRIVRKLFGEASAGA
ncbi:MAG: hypothetical protein Fues2KO_52900 [Fuerstiella sp.]